MLRIGIDDNKAVFADPASLVTREAYSVPKPTLLSQRPCVSRLM